MTASVQRSRSSRPAVRQAFGHSVRNIAEALAKHAQQRLGPAAGFSLRLLLRYPFDHALLEDVVEDGVILDVERNVAHRFCLFHNGRDRPAQLSENDQSCGGVAPHTGIELPGRQADQSKVLWEMTRARLAISNPRLLDPLRLERRDAAP